jgi:hypothetical protein
MATTTGYVQRLNIFQSGAACALIGPAPTNTTALIIQAASGDSPAVLAWKSSLVDGLTTAMASRQQVQAFHGDADSNITGLALGPG